MRGSWLAGLMCLFPQFLTAAVEPVFPVEAQITHDDREEFASHKLPVGAAAGAQIPTIVAEGALIRRSWRVSYSGGTTLLVMDRLRQQIEAIGFELLYECETRECGGFDFRFGTEVLPEPDMHIDLGDFRFLSAQRLGSATPEYISYFVSRSTDFAYVQQIYVGTASDAPRATKTTSTAPKPIPTRVTGELAERLEQSGFAVLEGIEFKTGSSELDGTAQETLKSLAEYLNAKPDIRVILVGHTDAEGSLQGNINLSQRRAESVARSLVSEFGASADQVAAGGAGFMSPRADNATEDGRALNRRVEVVVLP